MFKSASLTIISKLITAVGSFATVILLSRYLGAADRGICGWYIVVIAIAQVFSEVAAGSVSGFLMQKHPVAKIRLLGYCWSVLTAVFVTSFFFALHKINAWECGMLTVLCILNAANTLHLAISLAGQQFLLFNGLNIFLALGAMVVVFLFFITGHAHKNAYLYSLLLVWAAAFFIGFGAGKTNNAPVLAAAGNRQLLRESFANGLANQVGHLTSLLNSRMIYFLLPATALGVYSNAISISQALLVLPGSLGQVLFATVLNNKDRQAGVAKARIMWWVCLLILLVAFVGILVVPDALYQYIFGPGFTGVKTYLSVLAASAVFNGCFLVLSYWQSANGRFINNFYASAIGLLINAACCFFYFYAGKFTPLLGAYFIAIGSFALFLASVVQFSWANGGLKSLLKPPSADEIRHFRS